MSSGHTAAGDPKSVPPEGAVHGRVYDYVQETVTVRQPYENKLNGGIPTHADPERASEVIDDVGTPRQEVNGHGGTQHFDDLPIRQSVGRVPGGIRLHGCLDSLHSLWGVLIAGLQLDLVVSLLDGREGGELRLSLVGWCYFLG